VARWHDRLRRRLRAAMLLMMSWLAEAFRHVHGRHRDRVVSRDELNRVVWDGRIVSDDALTSRVARCSAGHR
jgi:UTP:GlnB (protein PII) uridylyltransferase